MQQTHPGAAAQLLVDSRNTLGEGATWCDATHALYWTDIEGARLWRCRADGSELAQWPMPERLACFALTQEPDVLLVGLATHLAFFDLRSGTFTRIVDVEPDLPTRLNDGRCDPFGAFVFGMKDEGGEPRARSAGSTGSMPISRLSGSRCRPRRSRTASRSRRTARRCTSAIRWCARSSSAITARAATWPTCARSRG
jgi:sugar lactone lactonase YvrE